MFTKNAEQRNVMCMMDKCIDQIQCRLHEQENPTWVPVFLLPF